MGLNTFVYPEKLFLHMSEHPNWEFIILSPKDTPQEIIGVMFCYKNKLTYVPSLVGMNYDKLNLYHTYRQLLYQTVKRAIDLNLHRVNLGLTASFEKRKLGATVKDTYAYIQTSDNFTLELIGLMESK